MASGYCFNEKHAGSSESLGKYMGKKVKSLYVPYLVFNGIFILLYNKLIAWNIYTDNPAFSAPVAYKTKWQLWSALNNCLHFNPNGTQQLCGADWFVIVLFYITILFAIVCWMFRFVKKPVLRNSILAVTGLAALGIGFFLQKKNLFLDGYWSPAITGYSLYVLGFFLAKLPEGVARWVKKLRWPIAVVGAAALLLATKYGSISLNVNHYTDPVFLVLCSLAGWFWLQAVAEILLPCRPVSRGVAYLSKSSLFILFLHFLGFKIVTAIQLAVYAEPGYLLASFPILHKEGVWWIAYTAAGILMPVAVKLLFDATAGFIKKKRAASQTV